jgi:hypothetical protein
MISERSLASAPPHLWQEQNVVEKIFIKTTMNSSSKHENSITRRNFMKKTILTTGAIMLLAQGVSLAAGSSTSGFWNMKCIAPALGTPKTKSATTQMFIPFTAIFDLVLTTTKEADSGSANGYNQGSVTHDFGFNMTSNQGNRQTGGKSFFKIDCNRSTGVITSSFEASRSIPVNGTTVAANFQIGLYSVDLKVYIARNQGGPDVQTKVFGQVYWEEILNASNNGSVRVPQTGLIDFNNEYEAKYSS